MMRQYFPRLWYDPNRLHARGLGLCPSLSVELAGSSRSLPTK